MSRSGAVAHILALATILMTAGKAGAQRTNFYEAPLRDPQVVIQGTGLRNYLDSVGEIIDPMSDQVDVELLASVVANSTTFTVQVDLAMRSEPGSIGFYNGHDPTAVPYEIFPTQAVAGWFAVISYRRNPTRAVVVTFDETAALQSQRTYPGADRDGIGFCMASTQAPVYSQDHRNPGGAAKALFFRGTGVNFGQAVLALESSTSPDPNDDFDDAVLFVHGGRLPFFTPVQRARWGEVKSRFR